MNHIRHIYLVGIAGVGVSALVPALLDRGFIVSGSDPARNELTARLESLPIQIDHEHRPENISDASLVVASSAIPAENPEILAARSRGIPVWPRARLLAYLLQDSRGIVVAGAHGKTTVTAMITQLLLETGFDPTAFIGGDCAFLESNARVGKGEWAVAEGDESDGSFLYLKPEIAVINNIDADHLDFYPDIHAIVERFTTFLAGVRENGWIIHSADCEHTRTMCIPANRRVLTYGFSTGADVQALNYISDEVESRCDVRIQGTMQGKLRHSLSGRANMHNALAAVSVGITLGLPFEQIADALRKFIGVKRRMQQKGVMHGITVIDDYAHHPTEILAAIEALRERYSRRLIGIFQPHLYSRTIKLREEFGRAFTGLDLLVLTDIYPAREKPIPGVSGETVMASVRKNRIPVVYIPKPDEIPVFLENITQEGDVVITIGAGDVWKIGEQFLQITNERKGGKSDVA